MTINPCYPQWREWWFKTMKVFITQLKIIHQTTKLESCCITMNRHKYFRAIVNTLKHPYLNEQTYPFKLYSYILMNSCFSGLFILHLNSLIPRNVLSWIPWCYGTITIGLGLKRKGYMDWILLLQRSVKNAFSTIYPQL